MKQARFDATWIEEKLNATSRRTEGTPHPAVTLASGEELTEEEVVNRVNSYEDILILIDAIIKVNYIHWEKILTKIINGLTSDQIKTLRERLGKFESRPIALTLLAKRLAILGRIDEARNFAEQALVQSTPRGWDPQWDGGSRLAAVESLFAIDANYDRKKIYELLVNDYLSESRYPGQFIYNLDRVGPILFAQPPLTDIWREIEQHIYQLSDFSEAQEFPPQAVHASGSRSHAEVLLDVLFADATLPIAEVWNEAHQSICELIHEKVADALISQRIHKLLTDGEENQVRALAVLEATMNARPDFAEQFSDSIRSFCTSPAMAVRQIAFQIAEHLKLEPALIAESRRTLPLTYQLELPEIPLPKITIPLEAIPEGQPYPDSDDPLELIRPFQERFEMVAKLSGIPLQNLVTRAVTLMNTLKSRDKWNKRAEEKLINWIQAAHLEMPFYRLRVSVALHAFGQVLAELADAQALDDRQLSFLQNFTRLHDPILSLLEPIPRPPEIVVPKGREMGSYPRKDWVNVCVEAFPLLLNTLSDGKIILGELSRFVHLDWEMPQEDRCTMICHPDWPTPEALGDSTNFFPSSSGWFAWNYPYLPKCQSWPSTIIYAHRFQVELTTEDWLAINPAVPLCLGWKRATEGLFRWVDAKGAMMVESLRWQDGSLHRHPPRLEEVSSEGWLVVASPEAAKLIAQIVGPAIRLGVVLRQYRDRDKKNLIQDFAVDRKPAW